MARLAVFQPVFEIAAHAHMWIERIVLEHHGDVAFGRFELVDEFFADPNLARRDGFQPGQHAQKGRFSAARGADENDQVAILDRQVDAFDRLDIAGIDLADVGDFDCSHWCYFSVSTRPLINRRCKRRTTSTGGTMASITVAMTRFQAGSRSVLAISRLIPITIV